MMRCRIKRSFPFSTDGLNSQQAIAGDTCDIPDDLVPGLEAEGYLEPIASKDAGRSPENKMIPAAEENKAPAETEPKAEAQAETKPTRRKGRKAK